MHFLEKLLEKYRDCLNLLYVESKDPETDPVRSKNEAKAILLELRELTENKVKDLDGEDLMSRLLKCSLSALTGRTGLVGLTAEEIAEAEEYLERLKLIPDRLHSDHILVAVEVMNHLGLMWSMRSQPEEAKRWLEEAEKLYKDFRNCPDRVAERCVDILGDANTEVREKELENAHTMTNFYLAQVYGLLKELHKSAAYCHESLRRGLMYHEYDPIDWALNSATLSQFFMERFLFKQARHHLAAASYVLDDHEESLKKMTGPPEEVEAKWEELRHRSADVSRYWAKYGLLLLKHSKDQESDPEEDAPPGSDEDLGDLRFDGLDLSPYENQIVDSEVVTFEDAREVFLVTQKHLNKAKEYYTLEDRASDHAHIVQDHSQLFRCLTAFEPDEERQFKMMKKRVDMLETVLKELNPRYYMQVCRQLRFELAATYHDMMQIRFQQTEDSPGVPSPQALMKINALVENSIANFNNFLDSVRDKKTNELPESLPEELLVPVLVAHFYLGRLYYKYITQDKRKEMENTKKALECFKCLADRCEKSEEMKNIMEEELSISQQMITLLQMKILRL